MFFLVLSFHCSNEHSDRPGGPLECARRNGVTGSTSRPNSQSDRLEHVDMKTRRSNCRNLTADWFYRVRQSVRNPGGARQTTYAPTKPVRPSLGLGLIDGREANGKLRRRFAGARSLAVFEATIVEARAGAASL